MITDIFATTFIIYNKVIWVAICCAIKCYLMAAGREYQLSIAVGDSAARNPSVLTAVLHETEGAPGGDS